MITPLLRLQDKITATFLTPFQSVFLLVVRLYWGANLAISGWNKMGNLEGTASFFSGLGLPMPMLNAMMAGTAELVGGAFLVLGLLSRPTAAVLTFNFIIAYIFGHPDAAKALFTAPADFIAAPAFTYLAASIIVLLFGSGRFSADTLLLAKCGCSKTSSSSLADTAPGTSAEGAGLLTRRDVGALAMAAVGGVIAGSLLTRLTGSGAATAGGGSVAGANTGGATGAINISGNSALAAIDAAAPKDVIPSLLLQEPHVCCGMNTCKGVGKGGNNACAGQGECATAETHVCQGLNTCKGMAGCGEFPGQNACNGKGNCAVPMEKKTWVIARKRFEELMKLAEHSFGTPPVSCKQNS